MRRSCSAAAGTPRWPRPKTCRDRHGSPMKQPLLGIVSTALIIIVSLAFVSRFDFPTFSGWVAYSLLCVIPIQIVMAVTWGTAQPRLAARAPQPLRGIVLIAFAAVVGAI